MCEQTNGLVSLSGLKCHRMSKGARLHDEVEYRWSTAAEIVVREWEW